MNKTDKKIIWDYNFSKSDLKNQNILKWYLTRKINAGDFSGLNIKELKKYYQTLKINNSIKELLGNFLAQYK